MSPAEPVTAAAAPAWQRWAPPWLRGYRRDWLAGDLVAGLIVTVMLIPQSLAYALLAGVPPQMGLYASIAPLVAYALFGSSMTLAVGPVAVIALMSATAVAPLAAPGSAEFARLSIELAMLSGLMLLLFGWLRLGFLAHLLSHPVTSGFISGSALLIIIGQLRHLLGVQAPGDSAWAQLLALAQALGATKPATAAIGLGSLLFLWLVRRHGAALLARAGVGRGPAGLATKLAPMLAVLAGTLAVMLLELDRNAGVAVVGAVPGGLPGMVWPFGDRQSTSALLLPALLIALVGFVESVSVAQSLAQRRRERIDANRELFGLGAANVASALSGGFSVTGGFARSVVNFDAGARTPLAGVISAVLMALVLLLAAGAFHHLPHAVLAATIVVAVASLIDLDSLRRAWRHDRGEGLAWLGTALGVLLLGVEFGIACGVALSLALLVWRGSRPHIAVVGRVPGTEHFRNVDRFEVQTLPGLLALRIDESLTFANAAAVDARIEAELERHADARTLLLILSAVNHIDSTALGMLTELGERLRQRGVELALAELKGPVKDRLLQCADGAALAAAAHLSAHAAFIAYEQGQQAPTAGVAAQAAGA
jgi:SulP family sulfate permease